MRNMIRYDEFCVALNEEHGTEFNQYKFDIGPPPFGPGYGFAVDPKLSVYSGQDSPYVDQYVRTPMMVNKLQGMIKKIMQTTGNMYTGAKFDMFMENVEDFENLKVLRINRKDDGVDVFISFDFEGDEFFGVFRDFCSQTGARKFTTEFFTDERFPFITANYRLKLTSFFYKILCSWFIPVNGKRFVALKDVPVRDSYGKEMLVKNKSTVTVDHSSLSDKIITMSYRDETVTMKGNDFFMFNYWFADFDEDYKD